MTILKFTYLSNLTDYRGVLRKRFKGLLRIVYEIIAQFNSRMTY